MSAGDGRTIERRIRISQRGGGSARCSGSRARVQPRNSCQRMPPSTTLQRPTSSHFSPNAPRASRCGDGHMADRRRSSLKIPEPPTLRARPDGNVTIPAEGLAVPGEALFQDHDPLEPAVPFAHEQRAGLQTILAFEARGGRKGAPTPSSFPERRILRIDLSRPPKASDWSR